MTGDEQASGWFDANRSMWDERVPIHVGGSFYDVDGFKAGRCAIRDFELAEVGDVSGKELVHLQCHFGLDTLSWARLGASVTGLDFSEPAVDAARAIASDIGVDATFVAANVYDAVEVLGRRTFDIVYTGLGALNWLPDLRGWAGVAAELVRPGGFLYVSEFHPFTSILGDDDLTVMLDYFHDEPQVWDEAGTYADLTAPTVNNLSFEWVHPIGDVVTAVIDAGLRLELLREHDYTLFPRWSFLEHSEFDTFRMPEGMPKIPLMYSLRAARDSPPPGAQEARK
jgi:SAM-dependent methyltransferase